ncbi:MAG TPA: NUDIX hydrolase [Candidatus Eisenbacteria bacterium]|nr:NUDIX hydrolase [Candidatus Eisenbacteria bacterium]
MKDQDVLHWAQRLQAIAQNGLTFARDPFDVERFNQVRRVAAEMMASGSAATFPEDLIELFKKNFGYATPKIDVRSAVFRDGRVLLVQERSDGCWSLPGGWADVGDPPSVAAVREVREESGYVARVQKLAAVYDRELHGHPPYPFHAYKLFFVCELAGGAPLASIETTAADFFPEDALPPLSTSRATLEQVRHMFEHHRHPEWPTTFD